jgi:hypothetical protein
VKGQIFVVAMAMALAGCAVRRVPDNPAVGTPVVRANPAAEPEIPETVEPSNLYQVYWEERTLENLRSDLQKRVWEACAGFTDRCKLLASRLNDVEADLDAYTDARLGARPETAWPVECPVHGRVYLTRLEHEKWMSARLGYSVCPICGRTRALEGK